MGSGSKRRDTDRPVIQRPIKKDSSGSGSGGGGRDVAEEVSKVCLPSFEVEIEQVASLKEGKELLLIESDGVYHVQLFGQRVATLSKQLSRMITECGVLGVRYNGKVVQRKKTDAKFKDAEFYARFLRSL